MEVRMRKNLDDLANLYFEISYLEKYLCDGLGSAMVTKIEVVHSKVDVSYVMRSDDLEELDNRSCFNINTTPLTIDDRKYYIENRILKINENCDSINIGEFKECYPALFKLIK